MKSLEETAHDLSLERLKDAAKAHGRWLREALKGRVSILESPTAEGLALAVVAYEAAERRWREMET